MFQCIEDSKQLSVITEQFIKSRPLMWEPVRHLTSSQHVPLYHKADVIYTKFAVDATNQQYTIYYLATGTFTRWYVKMNSGFCIYKYM